MKTGRMEKDQIDILILRFLEKKATPEECGILESWIEEYADNRRYFQQTSNLWHAYNPALNPDLIDPARAEAKVIRQIHKTGSSKNIWFYWQRIAAILFIPLLFLSAYLFYDKWNDPLYESFQEVTAPYGMISQVNLPDDSKVWLNGGSTLKYPLRFRAGKRNVSLTGEGYFEVEADRNKPFTVETPYSSVVATGTAFNVNAYESDQFTSITLANGKVDVWLEGKPAIAMKPGDQFSLNKENNQYTVTQTDPYKWYAWKDGLMIFRDDPLGYVFKRLEQTFNVEIVVKESGIEEAPYRATFEEESLNEILRLLELSAPIRFFYLEREKNDDGLFGKQQIEVGRKEAKKAGK